jgi:hypothetical protein
MIAEVSRQPDIEGRRLELHGSEPHKAGLSSSGLSGSGPRRLVGAIVVASLAAFALAPINSSVALPALKGPPVGIVYMSDVSTIRRR